MKSLKKIAILMLLSGALSVCAYAEDLNFNITNTTDEAGDENIIISINNEDVKWASLYITNSDGKIVFADDLYTDLDGNKSNYKITKAAPKYRTYNIYASITKKDGSVITNTDNPKILTLYTYKEKMDIINNILDGKADLKECYEILGIEESPLCAVLNNDSAVTECLRKLLKDSEITPSAFTDKYIDAVIETALKSKNYEVIKYMVSSMGEQINIDKTSEEIKWAEAFDESQKKALFERLSEYEYKNSQALVNEYYKQAFLIRFEKVHSSAVKNFIEKHSEKYYENESLFSFDFEKYNELSSTAKKEYAISQISGKAYKSLSDLKTAFDNAVTAAQSYNETQSNVRNTGSGNSGGGGTMTVSRPSETKDNGKMFDDLSGFDWAETEIEYLASNGIINGTGNKKFNPADNITREQFVKIVTGAFKLPSQNTECNFKDVNESEWYYGSVAAAAGCGIINGMGDNFGIGIKITREDMAVILYRTAQLCNIDMTKIKELNISDMNDINGYAKEAVRTLFEAGCISGKGNGNFDPKAFATRAEAAKLIYNMMIKN